MFAEDASEAFVIFGTLSGSVERECKSKYSPIIVFTCLVVSASVASWRAFCFADSGLSFGLMIVNGNHGLGPSGSVVFLHETRWTVLLIGHLSDHHFELVVLMVISYNWAGKLLVDDPLLPTLSRSGPPLPVSSWLRGLPWIFLKVAGNVILNWPVRMSSTKLSNWSTLSLTWDLETVAPSHMPSQRWNLPLTAHMNLATNRSSNGMWSLNVFLLHPIVMRSCLRLVEQTLSSPKKISHLAANRLKLSSHAVEVNWYVNCLFQWIFYFLSDFFWPWVWTSWQIR